MSSADGVGRPLPPITSNGTAGSSASPCAIADSVIGASDNSPAPVLATSAEPNERSLDPSRLTSGGQPDRQLGVGHRRAEKPRRSCSPPLCPTSAGPTTLGRTAYAT